MITYTLIDKTDLSQILNNKIAIPFFKSKKIVKVSGKKCLDEFYNTKNDHERKWIRCRNCNYKITSLYEKIRIMESDSFIFRNPAGIFYRIICFSNAPGLVNITDYTDENTWFKGYLWSISLCSSCYNHLGWHYISESAQFYGLIADRLEGI